MLKSQFLKQNHPKTQNLQISKSENYEILGICFYVMSWCKNSKRNQNSNILQCTDFCLPEANYFCKPTAGKQICSCSVPKINSLRSRKAKSKTWYHLVVRTVLNPCTHLTSAFAIAFYEKITFNKFTME